MKEKIQLIVKELRAGKATPYLIAMIVFLVLTFAYVSPVLEGKRLLQPDIVNWQGMAKEITDFREHTGEEPLWTNSMFGGMPAFQISVRWANNIASFFHDAMTLWLPRPADMIFLYFAGFFLFLLMLNISPWLALVGAIAFTFSSYNFIILEAGHNSKAVAIGYMAPVLGSIIYTFRRNMLGGGLLFAIFMGLQLFANHYQITYYLGMVVVIYGLFELYEHMREKKTTLFLKRTGVLIAGLVIAIGINIGNFWGTYSYASETMRGGTELSTQAEATERGLSRDYITHWSYGIDETLTLLIPNAKGGATDMLGNNPTAMKAADPGFRGLLERENQYWGDQPFTSGPVYVGAVVLFFFFLSLFYVKGPLKWSLLIAIILSIMLSWGKNFMPLTDFFIDYIPGYNKFRAVSMTLVIAGMAIPLMAMLGIYKLLQNPGDLHFRSKSFLTALGLTSGVSLLLYLSPTTFLSFISNQEARGFAELTSQEPQLARQVDQFLYALGQARVAIFQADAIRSFLFAAAAGLFTLLFSYKKIGQGLFIALLALLITTDMWPVNRRYLNNDHFVQRRRAERPHPLRPADQHILQDQSVYRVLDLTESTFNSARTSYHHHSIGGYHGAKLQRYQDLIDHHLLNEIRQLQGILQRGTHQDEIREQMQELNVHNMLNTRYIIYNPDAAPIRNPNAAGNAWLVNNYHMVRDADEEITALDTLDFRRGALIDQRFAHHLEGTSFSPDPTARISLTHYQPNELSYTYQSNSQQLAVFSEVFYPEGWSVSINGAPADHFRVNYILRGMVLPEGEHIITFSFRPASYDTGRYIALVFSMLLVAGIIAFLIRNVLTPDKTQQHPQESESSDA